MDAFNQIHHNGTPGTATLLQAPEKILIEENKYILSGEIGHYIAYCLRVIESWKVHNDMQWKKFSALNTKMTLQLSNLRNRFFRPQSL